jgi:hypothetical protein
MPPPEPKRPVVFSGENSMIRLFHPGSDDIVAGASYWRRDRRASSSKATVGASIG